MNTDNMYLFIYLWCMYVLNEKVVRICIQGWAAKRRRHLWAYLKVKGNVYLHKKKKTLPQHWVKQ